MPELESFPLKFSSARAVGLMFDPSGLIATPPDAPLMPPKSWPSSACDRSFVNGGELKLEVQAIRDWPAATPFTCRVPWYELKKSNLSF